MVSVYAECNRLPFDLPEAEQELVGGYHTEYSNSMKLGLMLLAEYAHMITTSFLMAILFLGGWSIFGLENVFADPIAPILMRFAILFAKMCGFVVLFLLVRWTIPRFRFDQLMNLAWKVMIPLSILHRARGDCRPPVRRHAVGDASPSRPCCSSARACCPSAMAAPTTAPAS